MTNTGIIHRIDDLGRVVIPREIRHRLHIKEGDPLELYLDGDTIGLKKYAETAYAQAAIERTIRDIEEDADLPDALRVRVKSKLREALESLYEERGGAEV